MKSLRRHISRFLLLTAFALASGIAYAAPVWEKTAPVATEYTESDAYDVKIADNAIILTLPAKTSVKVFTILGQLVAEKQLDAGTWRLPLTARGIYILKVGTQTRRITI